MRQVKVTAGRKVVQRFAVVACVAILGVGATACGDDTVTPGAPANTTQQAPAATTPAAAATTPAAPATSNPQSGGAGF